jgi:nucleoside-diphosphate-sugar epimerase
MLKNVLVTGGAGFIGSNLVNLLIDRGVSVTIIDNLSTGLFTNIHSNVTFIDNDLKNINSIKHLPNFDVVFHLAASVGRQKSIDYPIEDSQTNLISTIELLKYIVKNKVPKIIYSSSAAIYGELLHSIIDENHPINPDSPYGVSKLAAEKMIFAYSNLYGFEAVALRYFNIFGINQKYDLYGNVIPIFVHMINKSFPITIYGDGNQTRDFLNVKDVALLNYHFAITPKSYGYYNVGSGESITINNLVRILEKIYHKNINKTYLPRRPGDVLHCRANVNKLINKTNFKFSNDLEEGLKNYINWSLINLK